jgi:ClpP class serine protease
LRLLLDKLAEHGPVFVVVDQLASTGAVPVAIACSVRASVA